MQFVSQPVWGLLSDVRSQHRQALVLACFGMALIIFAYWFATDFWLLAILTILFAIMRAPVDVLITALALEHLEKHPGSASFGSLRLWGSVGFVAASFAIGALLIDNGGTRWIIPLYALTGVVLGVIALTVPDSAAYGKVNWQQGLDLLRRRRVLFWLLLSILLIGMTLGIVNNYFSIYMSEIAAPGWVIGFAISLSAIFEIPLLSGIPTFIRRWGIRLMFVVGAACLPLRWFAYYLIDDPLFVLPVQVLHSIGMMSLLVVGVLYVDKLIQPSFRASGQALYAASLHGIGPGIGLYFGGVIFEQNGISAVWLFSTIVGVVGVGLLIYAVYGFALPQPPKEVLHGD